MTVKTNVTHKQQDKKIQKMKSERNYSYIRWSNKKCDHIYIRKSQIQSKGIVYYKDVVSC